MSQSGVKQQAIRMWMELSVPDDSGVYRVVPLDICNFTSTFAKNSIPQASCCINVGVASTNTNFLSNIHYIVSRLVFKTRAVVYLQAYKGFTFVPKGVGNNEELLNDGRPFVVFDGYTTGSGYRRGASGAEYVISLEHWLTDLTASTALSPDLVPNTAFNTYFPAVVPVEDQPGNVFGQTVTSILSPFEIAQDLWGSGLLKFYSFIANKNALGLIQDNYAGIGNLLELEGLFSSQKNDTALIALSRILGPGNRSYVPLKLRDIGGTLNIVTGISEMISKLSVRSLNGSTFWDNILTFGAQLKYDVLPLINTAVVAPTLPNFYYPWKKIYASEISSIDLSTAMPRFLKGVVLTTASSENSGYNDVGNLPQEATGKFYDFLSCGIYIGNNVGQILIETAPEWLSQPVSPVLAAAENNFVFDAAVRKDPAQKIDKVATEFAVIANAFAKLVYSTEILKHRAGNVSGKLRFDIAPGSVVAVETLGEMQPPSDTLGYPLFAMVEQVATTIDCTSPSASTTFTLSNIRTAYENTNISLVSTANPLYDMVWNGCGMYL